MEKAQRYLQTCSVDLALEAKGRAGHSDVRHTAVHCASDGLQLWELHSPVSWCIHTLDVSLRVDDLDFISSLRFFFIRCHVLWFLFISPLQSLPPVLSLILLVLFCCFTWLYLICKVWLTKQEKQGQPSPPPSEGSPCVDCFLNLITCKYVWGSAQLRTTSSENCIGM